jgi:hypothetical protein
LANAPNSTPREVQRHVLSSAIHEVLLNQRKFQELEDIVDGVVDLTKLSNEKAKVSIKWRGLMSYSCLKLKIKRSKEDNCEIHTPWAIIEKLKTTTDIVSLIILKISSFM